MTTLPKGMEHLDLAAALPKDRVLHMLNLIRLYEIAQYPEGHPDHGKGISGLEAYRAYGRTSAPLFKRVGGRQVWVGRPEVVLRGAPDERYDIAFIAEYPSFQAVMDMVSDPVYQQVCRFHREAATAHLRLIRFEPLTIGEGFGET